MSKWSIKILESTTTIERKLLQWNLTLSPSQTKIIGDHWNMLQSSLEIVHNGCSPTNLDFAHEHACLFAKIEPDSNASSIILSNHVP